MKKSIFKTVLSVILLISVVSCGNASTEDRKMAFEKKMDAIGGMGFDVSKVDDNYMLTIKNAKMATSAMLSFASMNTLDANSRGKIEDAIAKAKVRVEIDWDKYNANIEGSVSVYFLGTGKESEPIRKIISAKKIGAYLSFDSNDMMVKVNIKDIDEKIVDGLNIMHIVLKNAGIDIVKAPSKESSSREFTLKGGEFTYDIEKNGTKEISFGYKNPICEVKKSNEYTGTQNCKFPTIEIKGGDHKDSGSVVFKDSSFDYMVVVDNKKVKSNISFKMPDIDIKIKDAPNNIMVQLQNLEFSANTDGIDESLMTKLYDIASNPSEDINKTIMKSIKIIGELFKSEMVFGYQGSLASVYGKSISSSKATVFTLKDFLENGSGSFGKTINFKDLVTIASINVKDEKSSESFFDMNGFKYGFEMKGMHNFFSAFMEIAMEAAQKNPKDMNFTKENEEKFISIGSKIVNDGFGLSLSPIGVDSIFIPEGKGIKLGKVDLSIDAKLNKNDVKMDSLMAPMLLLSFLQANGKLVLSKADLDSISNNFPPSAMAMVMMYAKYEGDKAVFILKFENGHLMVNDKPVM